MSENKKIEEKTFKELCDYLGGDLDSPLCQDIINFFEEHPECRSYLESVKQTVSIFKEHETEQKTPLECKQKIIKELLSKSQKKPSR